MSIFDKPHTYCKVQLDTGALRWYRTNERGYKAGERVVVPISPDGTRALGTITETQRFGESALPQPLTATMGIIERAGVFAQSSVERFNREISRSKYPPVDISISVVKGFLNSTVYCTCKRERELERKLIEKGRKKYIIVENYPPSDERDIPREARKRLERRLQELNDYELDRELLFQEFMDDLDQL